MVSGYQQWYLQVYVLNNTDWLMATNNGIFKYMC